MLFEFQQKETKGTKKLKKRTQVGQETDGRNQYSLDCFFFLIFVTFVPFCSRIEVQKDLWGKGRAGRRRSQGRLPHGRGMRSYVRCRRAAGAPRGRADDEGNDTKLAAFPRKMSAGRRRSQL